ncbi:DsbA family protein [Phenylobacterium sp.]|uniref:2-hydroxychromene-2-carboxylate isomerase n=1 Tax=Phenylobacterium sp. TaxID=1871053 RepID=UPI00286C4794|nr:DsbA family protein [Phenylobacterium sp.]
MTLSFDLYWSFRSPYSYMVMPRLAALEREDDVACQVKPVYPLAVRTPEFFEQQDSLWLSYFMTDVFREAAFLGLPFRWPRPDPVQRSPDEGYRMKQPHIHRLTHLGVAAAQRGRGVPFLEEVSKIIWGGATDNWHEGDHLAQAAERAGLDFAEMAAAVDADPAPFIAVVEENQLAQRAAGHWGVPMTVFNGEAFFGQDRFDQLKWRMAQQGLTRR